MYVSKSHCHHSVATFPEKRIIKSDNNKKNSVLLPNLILELSIDGVDHFYNTGMWLKKI